MEDIPSRLGLRVFAHQCVKSLFGRVVTLFEPDPNCSEPFVCLDDLLLGLSAGGAFILHVLDDAPHALSEFPDKIGPSCKKKTLPDVKAASIIQQGRQWAATLWGKHNHGPFFCINRFRSRRIDYRTTSTVSFLLTRSRQTKLAFPGVHAGPGVRVHQQTRSTLHIVIIGFGDFTHAKDAMLLTLNAAEMTVRFPYPISSAMFFLSFPSLL